MSTRILFVDDEPLVVQAIQRILHGTFQVDIATSGSEAVAKLSTERYAAIVSDMKMAGMSGAMLLKFAYQHYPDMARLLLTAQCDLDEQTFAISEGHVHGMLYKPCSSAELKLSLNRAILKVSESLHAAGCSN